MFHNVLMTTLTPLCNTNEIHCWDNKPFTTTWPEGNQEKSKDTSIKKTIKKKNKRNRTMFTTEQVRVLEKVFARSKYIDIERRKEIAECLQIDQKCVKIWFQNRRMKEKKELSESCDSASDSVSESVSPPPEALQPSNKTPDNFYLHPYIDSHVRPQYNYYTPNNYINTEIANHDTNNYTIPHNFAIPEYTNFINLDPNNFRNDTDYTAQYYTPQTDFKYYCNGGEENNQNIRSNTQDWPINIFDTSFL